MKEIKVLYVEDTYKEPIETDPYYAALLKNGYSPTLASTGGDAWRCLTTEVYDCIVLDVMLPRGEGDSMPDQVPQYDSGVFLLESLKMGKFPKNKLESVIVASAIADLRAMERIKEQYREVPYCEKPFYPHDLIDAIKQILERSNDEKAR